MKPIPIIISIVLLLLSIVRLSSTCAKQERREKSNAFLQQQQAIEQKRKIIFRYDKNNVDSLGWIIAHKEIFDEALDSSIKYYRDNYYSDEDRYKAYLNTLYEYKKLSYVYADWIKHNREYAVAKKKDTILHRTKYNEFVNKSRSILFNMNRSNVDLLMDY